MSKPTKLMMIAILAATLSAPAWADSRAIDLKPEKMTSAQGFRPAFVRPEPAPTEDLTINAEFQASDQFYFNFTYGPDEDKIYSAVLDKQGGARAGVGLLYIDLNNDEILDPEKECITVLVGASYGSPPVHVPLSGFKDGSTRHVALAFNSSKVPDGEYVITAQLTSLTRFEGTTEFAGKKTKIALCDNNGNGTYNDINTRDVATSNDVVLVDTDSDGFFNMSFDSPEMFELNRYVKVHSDWYSFEPSPDGKTLDIQTEDPETGIVIAPDNIDYLELHSPNQDLKLTFTPNNRHVEALAGEYNLAEVRFAAKDDNGRQWFARAYDTSTQSLNFEVKPDEKIELPDLLPLKVSVEPQFKSNGKEIVFEPHTTTANGLQISVFGGDVPSVILKDPDGKILAKPKFEYG
ncbi:hypothetical protein STSP2_01365 [Anaerohalosphaera lusitana]|uniref:Uncharacterized protein n=1 Tax=Anaerohalosphaera lusitana TaxID=1936003 RepID=A0A1U9NJX5_9BACT|nr:hypothetical protein [Anaerohalosphaera lusitana]AQT68209.1 hypothetical protein STSP2_01365 [Anaerohalosphaera lusitana]